MPKGYKIGDVPSIYLPLLDFLAAATGDEVVLTFAEIATLLGRRYLPESAVLHGGWWTNKRADHVQMWRALGWQAHASAAQRRVVFTRDVERAGETAE